MVKFFVDSVLSTGVSEETSPITHSDSFSWKFHYKVKTVPLIITRRLFAAGTVKKMKTVQDSLVVVLLLLLPPVLVELMDFNGHIPLLRQIKSLQKKNINTQTR